MANNKDEKVTNANPNIAQDPPQTLTAEQPNATATTEPTPSAPEENPVLSCNAFLEQHPQHFTIEAILRGAHNSDKKRATGLDSWQQLLEHILNREVKA